MATKVVVRHFHEGNDADRLMRGKAVYATRACIIDLDTGSPVVHNEGDDSCVCLAWAACNRKDVPSREQGRSISLGRLQKQFPEECAEADFGVFEKYRVR